MGLAAPLALFFLVFFVAPLLQLFWLSLHNDTAGLHWGVGQYLHFLTDPFSLGVLGSTLLLGAEVTAVCLLLGFPIAWLYHRVGPRLQTVIILIVLLPLLTSVVVRTFAWIVILGRQGIINATLQSLGIIDTPLRLLYTQFGVVLALAQVQMPLMTLPLITALGRIDPNLDDASCSLGAGSWRTFWKIVLPLSQPIIAVISVFALLASWKDYLWPLLVLPDPAVQPLSVRLAAIASQTDLGVFLASLAISTFIPVVFFLIFQRMFLSGAGLGGAVKG